MALCTVFLCWYFFSYNNKTKVISAKGCYARIPIQFVEGSVLVEMEIEKKKYPIKLDLGAACQFAFLKETLESIHEKKKLKFITTTDIKGNQYKSNTYSVPLVKSKNFACKDAIIIEESRDFITTGAVLWRRDHEKNSPLPFAGRIGRYCFTPHNLFIDFPNSMMFVTNSIEELRTDDWPISNLSEIPFKMGEWGIILSIETDMGVKKFILDTGANASILRSTEKMPVERQRFTTKKFAAGGLDFGPLDLSLFEITPSMDADGILGLDFLKNHAIYLDFANNKAFIGASSKVCGAIRTESCKIPLKFSSKLPVIQVEIEGNDYTLMLDLGNACEFELKPEVLTAISKKEYISSHTIIGLDGQKTTRPKYLLQHIGIPNGKVIHTIAEEDNAATQDNVSGRIGRKTLQTSILLIDFSHSLLLTLKNFEDLQTAGYPIENFRKIPFNQTRWGAVFTIETDFGPKRFFINTSAICSGIRNSPELAQKRKVATSKFKIGEVDLGPTNLDLVDIDPKLTDIDGYLGVDFFNKNTVFLDFQRNKSGIFYTEPN